MQFFRQSETEGATIVGWGVRVMLLSPVADASSSKAAVRISGLGGAVEVETDAFAALEALVREPTRHGLLVVECDSFGGLEAGRSLVSMLHKKGVSVPTILLTSDCAEQEFPYERREPVVLRYPVSAVSLRVGFQHAMRDRLVF